MMKKIVLVILILGLFGGGLFYWWNSQQDVRELNKTLPEGIRVEKSLFGEEYKVVNKIDGYEFKVPREWRGVNEVWYTPEREEADYRLASIELEGKEGNGRIMVINQFKEDTDNLRVWAETNFKTFGLVGDFVENIVGEFRYNVVKTQENVHLGGMFVYFFKKDEVIYAIVNGSEEFIKYIILNGKW